jgi:kynureninase
MTHDPAALARHYSRFRVSQRLLLTGHSHQAWPDVAFEAQQRAWLDAAELVDEKWSRAYEVAERVRVGWARLLGEGATTIALGQNTHELVLRFLFSLRLADRPKLVTTDAEFHTIRRQLARLGEEGLYIERVPGRPVATVAERVAAAVDDATAAVLISSVYYETAEIVPHLGLVADQCLREGAELLVDAYHHLNVVPFDLASLGLDHAWVTGGGYKYCQLGEGNAFLRVPHGGESARPVLTGWFSEFGELEAPPHAGRVVYGAGAARWAGATYDPTSHYRADAVFDFFDAQGLTPERLRGVSQHQIGLMAARCQDAPLEGRVRMVGIEGAGGLAGVGGFLALHVEDAARVQRRLRELGVLADHRGDVLRLGPAPYLTDEQLDQAMSLLAEAL